MLPQNNKGGVDKRERSSTYNLVRLESRCVIKAKQVLPRCECMPMPLKKTIETLVQFYPCHWNESTHQQKMFYYMPPCLCGWTCSRFQMSLFIEISLQYGSQSWLYNDNLVPQMNINILLSKKRIWCSHPSQCPSSTDMELNHNTNIHGVRLKMSRYNHDWDQSARPGSASVPVNSMSSLSAYGLKIGTGENVF